MGKIWMPGGGGGGVGSDDCTATQGDILKGKTAITQESGDEVIAGTLELTGNVTAPNVLTGRTYYSTNAKAKYTGTMPDRNNANNNASQSLRIEDGKVKMYPHMGYYGGYSEGSPYYVWDSQALVAERSGLTASKLMVGQSVLGVTGTATNDATAVAANIHTGKTAYVKGNKLTGTMPDQGAKTAALNCGGSYTIPAGYHNGSGKVTANSLASQTGGSTAEDKHVLSGKTYWKAGVKRTGAMTVSSVVSFSVATYSTKQVIATWKNPTKGPYSGVIICGKTGGYPTNKDDNMRYTGVGSNSALGATSTITIGGLTSGVLYYFRIWVYLTCSAGNQYSSHAQASATTIQGGRRVFTSSGTFTVPSNVYSIDVHCTGGGGGGGPGYRGWYVHSAINANGYGGGGGYTKCVYNRSVTPGQQISVIVGAGGIGGRDALDRWNDATGGSASSMGTIIKASGGEGGYAIEEIEDNICGSGGSGGGQGQGLVSLVCEHTSRHSFTYVGAGGSNGGNGYVAYHSSEPDFKSLVQPTSAAHCQGQQTSTREFATGTLYSGGGGAGVGAYGLGYEDGPVLPGLGGAGGAGGGGKGASTRSASPSGWPSSGSNGGAGTGGGGGGGGERDHADSQTLGGDGGSGNVIVRW